MKNEKLELMLNKVVEYNDPKAHGGNGHNFKAFLYKNHRGYYFKVVEIITGTDVAFNDIIYLQDGDEDYLVVASKPKLMRISKKSWHYRLLKYVLKSNAPTPHDMQNGCPYFWLVMFSLLVVSFIVLYKVVKWVVLLVPKILFWILKQLVTAWIAGLDDEAAYELNYNGSYSNYTKMPKTAKIFFENNDDDFFSFFLSKKYKVQDTNDPAYVERQKEIKAKWEEWRKDLEERRKAQRERDRAREEIERKRKAIHDKKRAEAQARWEERMRPFRTWRKNTAAWFKTTFTVERGRRNAIVKRTKQFVGAVVTLAILAATFFVVNIIAVGLTYAVDAIIAGGWKIFVGIAIAAAAIGVLYLLWVLISSWGQAVVNKYKRGKRVWYVEPFIYLVWIPIKYIALSVAFLVVWVLWTPIKFIFYTLLFKWFLKPIGLFIAKVAVGLVKGIGSSTGIFGEYFGASYSDYCPGLEWVDFDDED
jgi:hypothetical protein